MAFQKWGVFLKRGFIFLVVVLSFFSGFAGCKSKEEKEIDELTELINKELKEELNSSQNKENFALKKEDLNNDEFEKIKKESYDYAIEYINEKKATSDYKYSGLKYLSQHIMSSENMANRNGVITSFLCNVSSNSSLKNSYCVFSVLCNVDKTSANKIIAFPEYCVQERGTAYNLNTDEAISTIVESCFASGGFELQTIETKIYKFLEEKGQLSEEYLNELKIEAKNEFDELLKKDYKTENVNYEIKSFFIMEDRNGDKKQDIFIYCYIENPATKSIPYLYLFKKHQYFIIDDEKKTIENTELLHSTERMALDDDFVNHTYPSSSTKLSYEEF